MGTSSSSAAGSSSAPTPTAPTPAQDDSSCPVPAEYRNPVVYNVYGEVTNDPSRPPASSANPLQKLQSTQVLDPRNNMPLEANQAPCAGQRKPLTTERVQSTIPKGGTASTWQFPSPQMVFNALRRKNKGEDVTEDDMEGFVNAHNAMNESTWRTVMMWEQLHKGECSAPTLLKFQGKPHDLSPLAWMRQALGGPAPFDRHDWTVDRCGKNVRYIIDFYFFDDKAGTPGAFEIVTRPALDSFDSALDRVKMNVYIKFAQWGLPCPITGHQGSGAVVSEGAVGGR
ncbi:hypothetical protein FOA52_014191 [Chlamydomonas sp. UWO 241]|nr:hypothetical protein FOA52_014191 [Chlamydomonas sp. UWO 241]